MTTGAADEPETAALLSKPIDSERTFYSAPVSAWTSYLSVALVTALVYSRVSGTWLDDDHMAILGNDAVVKCDSIVDLFDTWSSIVDNDFWGVPLAHNQSHKSWRPVTTFSFRVGWCLHGSFLPGFHIVNTLLHVIATLLFQFLCESLVFHKAVVSSRKLRRSLAWTAAMLFGIHPLHVECVSNIVGRAEPLSAIFFVLTILVFSWGRRVKGCRAVASTVAATIAAISMCFLSILSKEQGAAAVAICMYLQSTVWSRIVPDIWSNIWRSKPHLAQTGQRSRSTGHTLSWARLLGIIVGSAILFWWRLSRNNGPVTVFGAADNSAAFAETTLARVLTYAHYHWLQAVPLVWPQHLVHDMSFGAIKNVEAFSDIRNVSSLLLYTYLAVQGIFSLNVVSLGRQRSDARKQTFGPFSRYEFHEIMLSGLALLILPFLPASNLLVTVGFTVAERVMYTPSMGFCIVFALVFHVIAAMAFNPSTSEAPRHGRHAQKKGQDIHGQQTTQSKHGRRRGRVADVLLLGILAVYGLRAYVRTADWDTEITLLNAGITACPTNSKLFANLAIALYSYDHDLERSVKAADWALTLKSDIHTAYSMRGLVFKDLNEFDQAEHDLLRAIEIAPLAERSARTNLGLLNVQRVFAMLEDVAERTEAATLLQSDTRLRNMGRDISRDDMVKIEHHVQEALSYGGHDPKVLMAVAQIHIRLGKPSMALVYLRHSLGIQNDERVVNLIQTLEQVLQANP